MNIKRVISASAAWVLPVVVLAATNLENPLKYNTLMDLIKAFLVILVEVAMPILVVSFVYVGFLFVKGRGNPAEIATAKKAFLATVIGAAIVMGAFVIATAIADTISRL